MSGATAGKGPVCMIDRVELGRRIRAARILAGLERADELTGRIRSMGVHTSTRSIYAIERGQQLPVTDAMLALVIALDPPGGYAFFAPAVREDVRDLWMRFTTPAEPELTRLVARAVEIAVREAVGRDQAHDQGHDDDQ